jgi:uroporphyrinogen decarboxylase
MRIDVWGVGWRKAWYGDGCYYWEPARHPLADATVADLDRYDWPDPLDPGLTAGVEEEARRLFETTDYAIVGDAGFKSLWETAYLLRGFEQMLMDLVAAPEFVSALLVKLLEINMAATGRFLDAAGQYIQVFRTADDLATQRGLLMSQDTFRRRLKPFYRRYFEFIRSKTDAAIFYHSCGNVTELVDDLTEIGVDILNPVQVSAMDDTACLKTRFGSRLTFWGAIDTQHVLPNGTPEEVAEEVRRRIHDLAPGGGYVLAAVHNIQPDVPPGNILAMADAAKRYGAYPVT